VLPTQRQYRRHVSKRPNLKERETTTASKLTNAIVIDMCTTRVSGIKKYITNSKTQIPVAGKMLKTPQVSAVFRNSIDTRGAVATKRAELKAAQKARDEAEAERVVTDEALKGYVTNVFGVDSTEAHELGYAPKKVAEKSVETKQQAIVRNKATREARHTIGPRQKAKIKGTAVVLTSSLQPADAVTTAAAVVTPVVAPAVSAAPVTTVSQASGAPLAGAAVSTQPVVAPAVAVQAPAPTPSGQASAATTNAAVAQPVPAVAGP
jgi:hypothetical protein